MAWYELTRWLAYRRIKHPLMSTYVWQAPLLLAAILTLGYLVLPARPPLASDQGLLRGLFQLLAILPGLFIAALAAVATFDRPEMDHEMPEPCPEVVVKSGGKELPLKLTRRTFLTYLFSYLTVLSVVTAVLCLGGVLVAPSVHTMLKAAFADDARPVAELIVGTSFLFVVLFCASSLLVTTLHGIYFLTERMHQPT